MLQLTKPDGGFTTGLTAFLGFATVPELRMGRASLDRLGTARTVKSANWHSVGARVETAA